MPKHIPLRSCVACRETKPKRELVRVVQVSDDRVEVGQVEVALVGVRPQVAVEGRRSGGMAGEQAERLDVEGERLAAGAEQPGAPLLAEALQPLADGVGRQARAQPRLQDVARRLGGGRGRPGGCGAESRPGAGIRPWRRRSP